RRAGQGRYPMPERGQLIAEQVEQEDEQRRAGDLDRHIGPGADQYQRGALLAQPHAHQQAAEDHHHHRGNDRRFQIAQHQTFSTSGRPRMPLGRNSSTRISTLKATPSLYSALKQPAVRASATPRSSPPSTAPGMLPMPPSTAAVNALSPAMKPI